MSTSVVVVTADRPNLLGRCLASLYQQTTKPIEVIVVDGSKNPQQTKQVVKRWTGRLLLAWIRDTKRSIPYARDLGAKYSHGDLVVYLDDDLAAEKTYLARMQQNFSRDTHLTAVIGRIKNAYQDNPYARTHFAYYNRGLRHFFSTLNRPAPLTSGRIVDCEVMGIRRSVIRTVGFPRHPSGFRHDDVELGLRLIQSGKKILFDPAIIAWTAPRTALLPLWDMAFREGYWDKYIETLYRVDLRAAPHRSLFLPWFWKEVQSQKTFPLLKKIWCALLLLSFPTVSRMGKAWYYVKNLL